MFSSHPKSKFWSKKNNISPDNVALYSNKKYWFDCKNCNHSFYTSISNITYRKNWCCYCGNKKLCDNNDCKICFEKSFASNERSKYLIESNPQKLFKNSHKKYKFKCNLCNHIFEISLLNVNNGYWCCYCGNKKLCDNNDCKICFEKSFASNERSKHWSNKNNINPREVFKNSHKKYLFKCKKNHVFNIQLDHITNLNNWCNKCNLPKGEKYICDILEKMEIKYEFQKTFKKCKYKRLLKFDFYIKQYNLLIEFDGEQHFHNKTRNKHFNKTFKLRRKKDIIKNKYSLEEKINLLRISYKEDNFIESLIIATLNRVKKEKHIGIVYSNFGLYKFPK